MIEGSCLCGGVRFELHPGYTDIYQCHCSRCRKVSGAASNAVVVAPASSLVWLSGRELGKRYLLDGDWPVEFCANCGSKLPTADENGQTYWVPAGLLDADPGVAVGAHIYVDSKADWDEIGGDAPQYPEDMG